MSGFSTYGRNLALDILFGGEPTPDPLFIALCDTSPSDGMNGSSIPELSGGGYLRTEFANVATNWKIAAVGRKRNDKVIQFPTSTTSWGTAAYFAICDAPTNGQMLVWGRLASPVSIGSGKAPRFQINTLTIELE